MADNDRQLGVTATKVTDPRGQDVTHQPPVQAYMQTLLGPSPAEQDQVDHALSLLDPADTDLQHQIRHGPDLTLPAGDQAWPPKVHAELLLERPEVRNEIRLHEAYRQGHDVLARHGTAEQLTQFENHLAPMAARMGDTRAEERRAFTTFGSTPPASFVQGPVTPPLSRPDLLEQLYGLPPQDLMEVVPPHLMGLVVGKAKEFRAMGQAMDRAEMEAITGHALSWGHTLFHNLPEITVEQSTVLDALTAIDPIAQNFYGVKASHFIPFLNHQLEHDLFKEQGLSTGTWTATQLTGFMDRSKATPVYYDTSWLTEAGIISGDLLQMVAAIYSGGKLVPYVMSKNAFSGLKLVKDLIGKFPLRVRQAGQGMGGAFVADTMMTTPDRLFGVIELLEGMGWNGAMMEQLRDYVNEQGGAWWTNPLAATGFGALGFGLGLTLPLAATFIRGLPRMMREAGEWGQAMHGFSPWQMVDELDQMQKGTTATFIENLKKNISDETGSVLIPGPGSKALVLGGPATQVVKALAKDMAKEHGKTRTTVEVLKEALDAHHLKQYGHKLDPTNTRDFNRVVKDTVALVKSRQSLPMEESGIGWYDSDIHAMFETLAALPGQGALRTDESQRVLVTAVTAATSTGQKVKDNAKAMLGTYREWLEKGQQAFRTTRPEAGATTGDVPLAGWGTKPSGPESALKVINYLLAKHGPDGFADWWLSPHTLQELTEVRRAAGLKDRPSNVTGNAGDYFLGAKVIGEKTGNFSLNMNGYDVLTKDLWFTRMYHRKFGQVARRNAKGEIDTDAPKGKAELAHMEEFITAIQKETGLSKRDIQASLWYYEQKLYTELGVASTPGSFKESIDAILTDKRIDPTGPLGGRSRAVSEGGDVGTGHPVRPRDADEAQRGESLEGYRALSPAKRTIRSLRRELQAADDDGVSRGDIPTAYTGGNRSNQSGVVTYRPTEAVAGPFTASGISTPPIQGLPIGKESAQQFHQAITEAMRTSDFSAQVSIKSVDDLAEARLFLTKDRQAGFAIMPDGDIVSVFNAKGSKHKHVSYALVQLAVEQGGKRLDAFDTFLPGIYSALGFKPVARVRWRDEFAPPNWNKETYTKFNHGEPDVVLMVHDPTYMGPHTGGTLYETYEEAAAAQARALEHKGTP